VSDMNSEDDFDALIKDAPVREKTGRRAASKVCNVINSLKYCH
jgi:hypothetical protein